jgi:hypothetical protein
MQRNADLPIGRNDTHADLPIGQSDLLFCQRIAKDADSSILYSPQNPPLGPF